MFLVQKWTPTLIRASSSGLDFEFQFLGFLVARLANTCKALVKRARAICEGAAGCSCGATLQRNAAQSQRAPRARARTDDARLQQLRIHT